MRRSDSSKARMTACSFFQAMLFERSAMPDAVRLYACGRRGRSIGAALLAVALSLSLAGPVTAAERIPVLKQVTAPHPYYWREMYVPQLTSGPSSVAWSRDGKSLYFSMQGRIWRQELSGQTARQRENFAYILEALLLAIGLVYMLMAALFNTLRDPFVIMLTLPMALVGAILA
ncbi:MAG: efflux RND transporter permease subunit, partial [Parvularculaceae bacterium]|nr:efflux RND transporter permease subunit [Parvularculaceae bacterium]